MLLSDREIKQYIKDKRIFVSPTPNYKTQLSGASLDLRLGNEFRVFDHSKNVVIDPKKKTENTRLVKLKGKEPFVVHPGEFVLGITEESVGYDNTLCATIHGKSSIGRMGIIVHSTAGYVNPGWVGRLTLEISNIGRMPVLLYPGMRICQLTFETLSGILNCPVSSNEYSMQIPILSMDEFDGCNEEIIESLGLERTAVDDKIPFILLENGYLYVYAETLTALKNTSPNFNMVKILGEKYGFNAICLFTLETFDKDSFAHSRFFTPYYGIDEDPVTGSSNGPLMLVMKKLNFIREDQKELTKIFEQGDIINRRGRVKVTHYPDINELYISGKAVTIIKGELFL